MSTKFEVQNIIDDGVGEFHVNHHIGFFDGRNLPHAHMSSSMIFPLDPLWMARIGKTTHTVKDIDPEDVTNHLQAIIEHVFNPNSTATCERGAVTFNGAPTLCFTGTLATVTTGFGAATASMPHDDWVYLEEHPSHPHLYGTTLTRLDWDVDDLLVETIPNLVFVLSPMVSLGAGTASQALDVLVPDNNGKHFLAGRRAWRCGFSEEHSLHFFETAAFERFSDPAYRAMEAAIRPMLNKCWIETVINISLLLGAPLQSVGSLSGYTKQRTIPPSSAGAVFPSGVPPYGPVYFRNESFSAADKDAAKTIYEGLSWFNDVRQHLPSLSPVEMPGF